MEIRHKTPIMPEGCRWCGIPYRDHVQSYIKSKGWHGWEPPTRAQIQARIRVRIEYIKKENS